MKSKLKTKSKSKSKAKAKKNDRPDLPKRAVIAKQWNTTESQLVGELSEDLLDAWKKLRSFAAALGHQHIYPSAKSIMFSRKVCYFFVRPKKQFLELWIFLPRKIEGLKVMQLPTKNKKYSNLFKVTHVDQVEEPLTDWLREAFEFAPGLED